MIPSIRQRYNQEFTAEKYRAFLDYLNRPYPGDLTFRVPETPVFMPKDFAQKMIEASERIVDVLLQEDFMEKTETAIPATERVPGKEGVCHFLNFDFGICENAEGELEPQLVEMQGFPTIYAFEALLDDAYRANFNIPAGFSKYLNGFDHAGYVAFVKKTILGNSKPENVVLLEILPWQQNSRIDFRLSKDYFGIETVCLTELTKEGRELFYLKNGEKTKIERIYNRVIFDDLNQQPPEIREKGKIVFEDLDVTWVTHPNWFYRVSKYTLPMLDHPNIPETRYLNTVEEIPADLENYVLKPLFSFSGYGVTIDVKPEDVAAVKDPENWILQRKVKYADAIKTGDGETAKAEIRVFYIWPEGAPRPIPVSNLARMSKGKMVGVRYNHNKTWVGSTCSMIELPC
ncbi:MAG: hypothetical protein QM642_10970 [Edaphocola sp.]